MLFYAGLVSCCSLQQVRADGGRSRPYKATGGWAGAIVIIRAGRTTLMDYEHGP